MPTPANGQEAVVPALAPATPRTPPIPGYLDKVYWWAYVHPRAVRIFEREWLVNLILFGQYGRLRDAALTDLGATVRGTTLQVACVYGNLTQHLLQRLDAAARLEVVDILPIQLKNLARKLPADERVALHQADASRLPSPAASYDQVLLFFLLHEQPAPVRRATLAEAFRVVRPGGASSSWTTTVRPPGTPCAGRCAPCSARSNPTRWSCGRAISVPFSPKTFRGQPSTRPSSLAGCTRNWC